MDIIVVISTYGRSLDLKRCVATSGRQDFAAEAYEVIIVDDGASEAVVWPAELAASRFSFRVVRRPTAVRARRAIPGCAKRGADCDLCDSGCAWPSPPVGGVGGVEPARVCMGSGSPALGQDAPPALGAPDLSLFWVLPVGPVTRDWDVRHPLSCMIVNNSPPLVVGLALRSGVEISPMEGPCTSRTSLCSGSNRLPTRPR